MSLGSVGQWGGIARASFWATQDFANLPRDLWIDRTIDHFPHEVARLPELGESLGSLRARLVDLLPIIRGHVYDPAFGTSFSIKSVLPAIVQNLGYDDLEIQEGTLVSVAFAEMRLPETPPERRQKLRAGLLAYCKRDTEAMLELFKVLR